MPVFTCFYTVFSILRTTDDTPPPPPGDFSELKRHTMPINFRNEGGASLHPGGDRFIAGGSDLWVRVFDYNSGKELECLKVTFVLACCFVGLLSLWTFLAYVGLPIYWGC